MKHLSSPTPFLHTAGRPILTYSFNVQKLIIMNLIESKMLLGQEALMNEIVLHIYYQSKTEYFVS